MLEKCLRLLFEKKDVSLVKQYVQSQLRKISNDRISLQELTFAREFRGLQGYRPTAMVPALELTRRFCKTDRMSAPNVGERVPYVIVYGEPGRPLIHSVRSPKEVLASKWSAGNQVASLRPNATYYITKVIIPALSRCLSLVGADVMSWYTEMPKLKPLPRLTSTLLEQESGARSKGVIPHYFITRQCPICLQRVQTSASLSNSPICSQCLRQPNKVATKLSSWIGLWDGKLNDLDSTCRTCTVNFDDCVSLDCPQLYIRTEAKYEAEQVEPAQMLLKNLSF